MAEKLTAEMSATLVEEYKAHVADYAGDPDKINKAFFTFMRKQFDEFAGVTDNQMRGLLVNKQVYQPTNPRQTAKKQGKKKTDFVAELQELVGQELPSANKLTIADIEILIDALK